MNPSNVLTTESPDNLKCLILTAHIHAYYQAFLRRH